MQTESTRQGWIVTGAATGIGLVLGVLYAWSVIKGGIPDSWQWTNAQKALPYSVACLVFALTMVPAGRLQDRVGPRRCCSLSGLLCGLGFILAGLSGSSLAGFVLGFGVCAGVGIGFGYAAITPAAIKWFPPRKTGLIAGIVVAGVGLASVYIAPLTTWLLALFQTRTAEGAIEPGVSRTLIVFGAATIVVIGLLARAVKNPPAAGPASGAAKAGAGSADRTWRDMIGTGQFWTLYVMYFCGAAAGLTFISVAQDLGKQSLGNLAFLAVVVLALGNAGGRIAAGTLSDKLGRQRVLLLEFVCQAVVVGALYRLTSTGGASWPITLGVVMLLGMNYGANLALFPAAAKDYFGLKHFGLNYGLLFTAWGAAGLVMPWLNGLIKDATGKTDLAYLIIIGMMVLSAALTFVSRRLADASRRTADALTTVAR
jgi:nitrate/nitrite transporter NarK